MKSSFGHKLDNNHRICYNCGNIRPEIWQPERHTTQVVEDANETERHTTPVIEDTNEIQCIQVHLTTRIRGLEDNACKYVLKLL